MVIVMNKIKKRYIWIALLLLLLYATQVAKYFTYLEPEEFYRAYLFGLLDVVIVSVIMQLFPFIWRLCNKNNLVYKKGNRVCYINSIVLFIISSTIYGVTNQEFGIVGVIGAVIYYFINKWLFVDNYIEMVQNPKEKTNKKDILVCSSCGAVVKDTDKKCSNCNEKFDNKDIFVCSSCGTKVSSSDRKCPKCNEIFEGKKEQKSSIDQKVKELSQLKKLLDNGTLTQEEFDKEKKKVLD